MPQHPTRRRFLQQVAIAGVAGPLLVGRSAPARAAADKVHIACIGVGGKGWEDMHGTAPGNHIVAICDIDANRLEQAAAAFPTAKRYTDWRKMLEQKDIDAVTVSTPDHTHAPASYTAMKLGKHVYTQKPLTHSVFEARRLTEVATETGAITQLGTQHHATGRLKAAVKIIQDEVIGKVREVHTWTDRPVNVWPQGLDRPNQHDPVPKHVAWDLWLGAAPERPYAEGYYHPFNWRGWWDFGTGALGDMGCHILDPVATALELPAPTAVWAEGPKPHAESGPLSCIVHYEFQGAPHCTDLLHLTWYEAKQLPPRELFQAPAEWDCPLNGILFVGEKGTMFVGLPEPPLLFPQEAFADSQIPEFPDHDHYQQWTNAILGQGKTSCAFSFSGPMTEMVLLGNVAYRCGKRIDWDSKNLKAVGVPEADQFIRRQYRLGYQVEGLG